MQTNKGNIICAVQNKCDQNPTRCLSSIWSSVELRMERNTSSASCCTLTAKQRDFAVVFFCVRQIWDENVLRFPLFPLTANPVSVQTMEEVVVRCRLRDVTPHGGKTLLQVEGDVTIIPPHASSFPPLIIHKSHNKVPSFTDFYFL